MRGRATPGETEKNSEPARATVTNASPATWSACTSTSRARPDSFAPELLFQVRRRRSPLRVVVTHARTSWAEADRTGAAWPAAEGCDASVSRAVGPVMTPVFYGMRPTWVLHMRDTCAVTTATTTAVDPVLADAVDVARVAAETEAPGLVGEHLGVEGEGEPLATHRFATRDPAYRGWNWAVTLTRAARAKTATVDEAVLLPGDEALLPPPWVPWHERLRPGDLGVGDLLPTQADDPRLVPGYTATEDDEERAVAFELGLGRARVLSF